jgi:putative DNA topoisomerase
MAKSALFSVPKNEPCPQCGAELTIRSGKHGPFLGCSHGCSNYPECEHTEVIDKPDETAIACPQCQKGQLVQRRSRYGKTFWSCDCYPECQFVINLKPVAGICSDCQYPLLIEKKTAQGVKRFCANKQCGKPVTAE